MTGPRQEFRDRPENEGHMRPFRFVLTFVALFLAATVWIEPTLVALEPPTADLTGSLGIETSLGLPSDPTGQWPQVPLLDVEQRVFELVNEERAKLDMSQLLLDPALVRIARTHSADMLDRGFFDHVNPDGDGPADRVAQAHRRLIGGTSENVWTGIRSEIIETEELAGRIMNGLMNSPGHRANILTEKLTHLGVGVTRGPGRRVMTWQTMATQLFAEVAAYTADPVPESLQWGSMANFSIAADSSRIGRPEMFDLWSKEEDRRVFGPEPTRRTQMRAPVGTYELRFYFRVGSTLRFAIHSGPRVVIVQ